MNIYSYLIITAAAVLLNIYFGYLREGCAKFSPKWFFWIHASIPVLIFLRLEFHTAKLFIPVTIFFAVIGQIIGSRYRRSQMTVADQEHLQQIPNLKIPSVAAPVLPREEVAIVLLNMGGPRNIREVRPFLRRIFLDPFIIRFPLSRFLQNFFAWLLVTLRGKATEERYHLIGGGSPILRSTALQAHSLSRELIRRGHPIKVLFEFNYSWPLPEHVIPKLKRLGKKYLLPVSLYPHYSLATTGSNMHYLKAEARKNYPDLKFLEPPVYFLAESYIQAFVDRIKEQVKPGESLDDFYLLFSAHGLPLYFLTEGDPYPFQITQTVTKILDRLGRKEAWSLSYQSDVGPLQWLKPSTENILKAMARRGVKKLIVVPVSFVTDHIETLCEIDIEYRKVAEDDGITDFRMSRALECHPGFINALADSVETALNLKHEPEDQKSLSQHSTTVAV